MKARSPLFHDITIKIAKVINIALMALPFIYVWYTYYADELWVTFYRRGHWLVIGLYVFLYIMIGRVYEAFKISYSSISEMVYSQVLTLFEVNVIMYIVAWLLIRHLPNVLPVLGVFILQILFSIIWCHWAQWWYYRTFPANKTVVVWDMREGVEKLIEDYNLSRKYKVTATVRAAECLEQLSLLDGADTVFLFGVHSHGRNIIVKYCLMHNISAYLVPRVGDLILSASKRDHLFHLPLLSVSRARPYFEYQITKRLGDILLSLIAAVVLSPVMLVTAICIKCEDHGPVIYKQTRLTKDGKEFQIYKFRSMRTDAEKDGVARLSTGDADDRITKTGRFIRKVRIDELPQLFNILKGDLSIVGPRAERPEIAAEYEKTLPEFALRLQVKAGLTGYAQVYGKYNTTPYDKLLMDLMYIGSANVFEDLKIIFATVKILFLPESTEGVDPGQVTALDYENEANRTEKWEKRDEHWAD